MPGHRWTLSLSRLRALLLNRKGERGGAIRSAIPVHQLGDLPVGAVPVLQVRPHPGDPRQACEGWQGADKPPFDTSMWCFFRAVRDVLSLTSAVAACLFSDSSRSRDLGTSMIQARPVLVCSSK